MINVFKADLYITKCFHKQQDKFMLFDIVAQQLQPQDRFMLFIVRHMFRDK